MKAQASATQGWVTCFTNGDKDLQDEENSVSEHFSAALWMLNEIWESFLAQGDKEYNIENHLKLYGLKYHPSAKKVQGDLLGIKIGEDVGAYRGKSNSNKGLDGFGLTNFSYSKGNDMYQISILVNFAFDGSYEGKGKIVFKQFCDDLIKKYGQ